MRLDLRPVTVAVLPVALSGAAAAPALAQARNPDREAYFGETHVHTNWSLDAFSVGSTVANPGDAYTYFKGEPVKHPLAYDVKIDTPLVWAGNRKPDQRTGVVPPIGGTVNVENATYSNTIGGVELKTVRTAPEFDPTVDAFYYARVLEIRPPRGTTMQARKPGVALPDVVAATIQERAWSSPIWYTPSVEARKNAKPGLTVADLKKRGAVTLNDVQLKTLIVEKWTELQNTVTGDTYMIIYAALGKGAAAKSLGSDPPRTSPSASLRTRVQSSYVTPGSRWGCLATSATGRTRAISAAPSRTSSATGGSSPSWSARRSRPPSTRWATRITARAATSSGTRTTRSSRPGRS